MAVVAGVDLDRLIKAQKMLQAEADACTDAPIADRLAELAGAAERICERLKLRIVERPAGTYVPTEAARSIPDQLMRQMLTGGRDLWISEALDISRPRIESRRRALGVRSFTAGGSAEERSLERRQWESHWLPKLTELGYLQRVGDAA